MNLVAYICRLLGCEEYELPSLLSKPSGRVLVEKALADRKLYTTYGDKMREITFHGLSHSDSRTMAYNGYLGVTVRMHFYVKYRIRLAHPALPLVVYVDKESKHRSFYPMELLLLIPTDD
jgi:hypothetical protein